MNTDSMARKISNGLLKVQKGFASFMTRRTAGCSLLSMKILFITVCSLFIALSVWFIVDAFTSKPQIRAMHVRHIRILPLVKEKEETAILLTMEAYKRL